MLFGNVEMRLSRSIKDLLLQPFLRLGRCLTSCRSWSSNHQGLFAHSSEWDPTSARVLILHDCAMIATAGSWMPLPRLFLGRSFVVYRPPLACSMQQNAFFVACLARHEVACARINALEELFKVKYVHSRSRGSRAQVLYSASVCVYAFCLLGRTRSSNLRMSLLVCSAKLKVKI